MINISDSLKTIYDPCAGIGGLLEGYSDNKCYANEINKETFDILQANMYALNINCISKCCNSLEEPINKYDYIITNPPLGNKNLTSTTLQKPYNTSINMFIMHCIDNLNLECCIILPIGRELFSEKMVNIRKILVTTCTILQIMTFRRTKFSNTNIQICIIHFKKGGTTQHINYIDPDFNLIKKVTIEEMRENHYILDYNSYYDNDNNGIKLQDMGTFSYKSERVAAHSLKEGKYKFFTSSQKTSKINEYDYDGEYIIFGNGGICNIHYINEKFAASDHCFVLKVNAEYNAKYICEYLLKNITLISDGFRGSVIQHLSISYLRNVRLNPPSLEIQNRKIVELDNLEKERNKLMDQITELNIKIRAVI